MTILSLQILLYILTLYIYYYTLVILEFLHKSKPLYKRNDTVFFYVHIIHILKKYMFRNFSGNIFIFSVKGRGEQFINKNTNFFSCVKITLKPPFLLKTLP